MSFQFWVALLIIFCASAVTTFLLISANGRLRILDHPNERSLHSRPTPRTGGISMWLGIIIGCVITTFSFGVYYEMFCIIAIALLVGAISFVDDRTQLPVRIRLIAHLIAGYLLLLASGVSHITLWPGGGIELPRGLIWFFGLLYVAWMTNLYNFMDGMDGFAGGMAVIGFGTLGLLGHLAGDDYYTAICWIIAAAAAGFLVWNFPPARIFMGDVGSSSLGLLAAALSLWADRSGLFPLWLAVLVFIPFIFDATVTLARRTLQGKRIWEAHRNHYYQRLVQSGWSHRRTVLWEYGLMLLCSASALVAYRASSATQCVILIGVGGGYVLAIIGVHGVEKRHAISQTSKISP